MNNFYLQPLLDTSLLAEHSGLFELIAGFLEQGEYFKGKSEISRRVSLHNNLFCFLLTAVFNPF